MDDLGQRNYSGGSLGDKASGGGSTGGLGSALSDLLTEETSVSISRQAGGSSDGFDSAFGSGSGLRVRSSSTDGNKRSQGFCDSPLFLQKKSKTTLSSHYDGKSELRKEPPWKKYAFCLFCHIYVSVSSILGSSSDNSSPETKRKDYGNTHE
ncbi:hypothetical protein E1301_Tti001463 [Triplophysa tibetana]|uniref:Uncharacterized protein n=1 Tax=Triplophysa tibetana TaxID=1572043 RepID=A0A5A9P7S0_9TELE|nr:hypothetical protein E1301_Tti001463 [Triplophysa tibetana]